MSVAIFTPTPDINKWHNIMSLCNNSSGNKSYRIHGVNVKVSAQVITVTYMHQSQPWLHLLHINLTVHLELWPGNHLIWCNSTYMLVSVFSSSLFTSIYCHYICIWCIRQLVRIHPTPLYYRLIITSFRILTTIGIIYLFYLQLLKT